MNHHRTLFCAAIFLVIAACSQCQKKPGAPARSAEKYLSTEAEVVVWIPNLKVIGERILGLEKLESANFLSQLQGFPNAHELATELMRQVGLDLRNGQEIAASGIDPASGMGAVIFGEGDAYAVVGTTDPAKIEETVATLAKTRLGLAARGAPRAGDTQLVTFAATPGASPRLGYFVKDGFAFVVSEKAIRRAADFGAALGAKSLLANPDYRGALSRLGSSFDLACFFPRRSTVAADLKVPAITLLASFGLPKVLLRADIPVGDAGVPIRALEREAGPDLTNYLPLDAFFAARFQGDPSQLETVWPRLLGPYVERAVRASGFDFKGEVLNNLKPGLTASLSLAPRPNLGGGIPELDVRRTNPFGFFHLAAIAEVRDQSKASAALEKIPAVARRLGALVDREDRRGRPVYWSTYAQGEGAHFGLSSNRAFIAAPRSRVEEILDALDGKSKARAPLSANPEIQAALSQGTLSAVFDFHQLAQSVRVLPSDVWGLGGFAIKASVVRWLDAMKDLRAITFQASARDSAIQAVVTVGFEPS